MGYETICPEEAINGHCAFISRRRALRSSEEYRTPADSEWDEFLGHFERRKLALGECGRAYGASCQHEHSCIRCPVLRVDPAQRFRLVEIRDNLAARIAEADSDGWIGEAEGLRVSLSATEENSITSIGEPVVPFNSTCQGSRISSRTPFNLPDDRHLACPGCCQRKVPARHLRLVERIVFEAEWRLEEL